MADYIEFLEGKKFPPKNADRSNSPDFFKDCGYVLTEDELVVDIDCLDKDVIGEIIKTFNIKTQIVHTNRGMHLYYRKPQNFRGNKKVCPLGFEVEYKTSKNSKYITIKQNGELRKIENEGVREELPDIFYTNRRLESLLGLVEGDSRNSLMFTHRMKISHLPDWKNILRFINSHVLSEPLDEKEFESVARETKLGDELNNEIEIAEYLINKYKIVMYLRNLYWFDEDEYKQVDDLFVERLIASEFSRKSNYVKEILKQIEYKVPIVDPNKTFDIKFKNGFLRDGEFIELEHMDFTPYYIQIPYHADAMPVKEVDDFIDHLTNGDPDYRLKLLEALGHIFVVSKEFKRLLSACFFFIGPGGNGKSTLFSVIREILGSKNVSSLSVQQLGIEMYQVSMISKLVNLGDDIDDEYIKQSQCKAIKNITTCDLISLRRLYQQSFDAELTCTLMFTSNHQVKAKEKGNSFKRRVNWFPTLSVPKVKDRLFIKKLTSPDALKYWIRLMIEGYQRLYQNNGFTYSAMIEQYNEEYHRINNNILEFLEDKVAEDYISRKKRECYREYKEWCLENDEYQMQSVKFHETLCDYFKIQTKRINVPRGDGLGRTSEEKYVLVDDVKE